MKCNISHANLILIMFRNISQDVMLMPTMKYIWSSLHCLVVESAKSVLFLRDICLECSIKLPFMGMLLSFEVMRSAFRILFLISNLNLPCCNSSHFSSVENEWILPFTFVFGLVGHAFHVRIFLAFFQTLLQIDHFLNYSIKTSFTTPIASYQEQLQANSYFMSCICLLWHSLFL